MSTNLSEPSANAVKVRVLVNKHPVQLVGPRVSGLDVKSAAIAQGVTIDIGFVLSLRQSNGKTKIIGDNDVVTINKNSVFTAIANDDNS